MPDNTKVYTSLVVSLDIAEVLAESSEVVDVREELVLLSKEVVV